MHARKKPLQAVHISSHDWWVILCFHYINYCFEEIWLFDIEEEFLALRHQARQPKMTCPSTISSTPNEDHSGGNTKSSASFQPPPSSTSHKTTLSPTHSLSPFQTITRKPTKIPSPCAPAKVLSSSCMSAPNRNYMDNQQEKVSMSFDVMDLGITA